MARIGASQILVSLLFAFVAGATIVTMFAQPIPYGWLGVTAQFEHPANGEPVLRITSVEPGSAAARGGLVGGDRVIGFPSLDDRIAFLLEAPQYWLAAPRPVTVFVQRGLGALSVRMMGSARTALPLWFVLTRLSVYLLGVLVVCVLVFVRPSIVTWTFALYVILFLWPNFWYLQYVGVYMPPIALFATVLVSYWTITLGALALVVFATRFPEGAPHPRVFRTVERAAIVFLALVGAAFTQYQAAQFFGWPTLDYNLLNNAQLFVPTLTAIVLLGWTFAVSRPEERTRLAWAIAGPSLCALFQVIDAWITANPSLPFGYGTTAGFISSIAPFAMMYAILRYKVIDVGFTLDRSFARAVSLPMSGARDEREARRMLVRRVALLFSVDLPLHELYAQLAELLGSFVNADCVLIASRGEAGARLEYVYEDGAGGCPDDVSIPPESLTAQVFRDGEARLVASAGEWPFISPVNVDGQRTTSPESGLFVPVEFGGTIVGLLSVQTAVPGAYDEDDLALLEACAIYLGPRMASGRPRRVSTRAAFDDAMAREWTRAAEAHTSLGVLVVDVDFFGVFNAIYGLAAAESCLQQIGEASAAPLGAIEHTVCRYGGDRFALVLYGADETDAARYAQSIASEVRALEIPHQGSSLGCVTVSIGTASRAPQPGPGWRELVANAEGNLARAKRDREARPAVVARDNLPAQRSSFVGRAIEIRAIEEALGESRLVTVAGPGGVGKSRVALEVARRAIDRYPDGVWFVDLASVTNAKAALGAIAEALGLESAENVDHVADSLSAKRLLLVLNDCEHLITSCASLARAALKRTRDVRVLATSREPLSVPEEHVVRLPPLRTSDGVALFLERTGRVASSADRDAVERIVAKLDGLPMAIELAAARGRELSPPELLLTLDETTPGQQSLRALFDWSYKRLTGAEQAALRRLSVFSGGWTLDAAVALCTDGSISNAALRYAIESLEAKSLILREERDGATRFRFLETTRQYAFGLLERHGEDRATVLRHLQWATAAAFDMTQRKRELSFGEWLALQTAEFGNYGAALREALGELDDGPAAAIVLRSLCGVLAESPAFGEFYEALRARVQDETLPEAQAAAFWLAIAEMTYVREPSESLEAARRAADLFRVAGDALGEAYGVWFFVRAEARVFGGIGASMQSRIESALNAARASGDRRLTAGLLRSLARVCGENGRSEPARAALREAAEVVDPTDTIMLAAVIASSADEELRTGNVDGAIAMWSRAASLAEELRPSFAALCFINIGIGEIARGDLPAARVMLAKGLSGAQRARHAFGLARAFDGFARLFMEGGNLEGAARIAGFAAASYTAGPKRAAADQRLFLESIAELRRKLGSGSFESEYTRGRALGLEEAVAEVA